MSQENVDTVRGIYERWSTGDFGAGLGDLDPRVMFLVAPDFPESGMFIGPEGINVYLRRFLEQWESFTLEAQDFQPVGDTVLVRVFQRSKGRASGIASEGAYYMLFSFRGRKVIRIETVMQENEALEAVGLRE